MNRTTVERKSDREVVVTRTFDAPARLVFGDDPASPMAFFGKYLDVVPNQRIVWTNEESGADGSVTTVTFEEKNGKTTLVMSELYPTKEALDAAGTGAQEAMNETFGQLDELLASLAGDP